MLFPTDNWRTISLLVVVVNGVRFCYLHFNHNVKYCFILTVVRVRVVFDYFY